MSFRKSLNPTVKPVSKIVSLLFLLQVCSCTSWRAVEKGAFQTIAPESRIRVGLKNGDSFETSNYYVNSDTLIVRTPKTLTYNVEDRRIPFSEIESIQTQKAVKADPAVVAALLSVLLLVVVAGAGLASGISHVGT